VPNTQELYLQPLSHPILERISFSLRFANSLNEYERILSLTIFGIKKPLLVSLAQLLIIVLFVTPTNLLTSIGVNSNSLFFQMESQ